ncbi:cysteine hydrolase [Uliginosibacterium sp. sgz301328]|uniref:cysteine hydrolase n=1 Tax=Uliginosibacterium sp. sgz301328 TaxID=3243764 RepID=UPI00359EE32E
MPLPRRHLLVIDPQNDFCDLPPDWRPPGVAPALPVAGAHADMLRLAEVIDAAGEAFDAITVTLDSHQRIDIGHPTFWIRGDGSAVTPFTQVTADDVRAGRIVPRREDARGRVVAYLDALEAAGRYTHMVWPVHCEIGSWGHNIHAAVLAACDRWEERALRNVDKVIKGTNPWTEHYSAIRAEVPNDDVSTQANMVLLSSLASADEIFVAGEAASHCVKATVEHVADALGASVRKLVLIEDCMSPVGGFESQARDFFGAMRQRGARTMRAAEVVAQLGR